jgi:hypothetical protein
VGWLCTDMSYSAHELSRRGLHDRACESAFFWKAESFMTLELVLSSSWSSEEQGLFQC